MFKSLLFTEVGYGRGYAVADSNRYHGIGQYIQMAVPVQESCKLCVSYLSLYYINVNVFIFHEEMGCILSLILVQNT